MLFVLFGGGGVDPGQRHGPEFVGGVLDQSQQDPEGTGPPHFLPGEGPVECVSDRALPGKLEGRPGDSDALPAALAGLHHGLGLLEGVASGWFLDGRVPSRNELSWRGRGRRGLVITDHSRVVLKMMLLLPFDKEAVGIIVTSFVLVLIKLFKLDHAVKVRLFVRHLHVIVVAIVLLRTQISVAFPANHPPDFPADSFNLFFVLLTGSFSGLRLSEREVNPQCREDLAVMVCVLIPLLVPQLKIVIDLRHEPPDSLDPKLWHEDLGGLLFDPTILKEPGLEKGTQGPQDQLVASDVSPVSGQDLHITKEFLVVAVSDVRPELGRSSLLNHPDRGDSVCFSTS